MDASRIISALWRSHGLSPDDLAFGVAMTTKLTYDEAMQVIKTDGDQSRSWVETDEIITWAKYHRDRPRKFSDNDLAELAGVVADSQTKEGLVRQLKGMMKLPSKQRNTLRWALKQEGWIDDE